MTEARTTSQRREQEGQHLAIDTLGVGRRLLDRNMLGDPLPKGDLFQKFRDQRTHATPGGELFVGERDLNLMNLERLPTIVGVLHFFVSFRVCTTRAQ